MSGNQKTQILIIDSEESFAQSAREQLERQEYDVTLQNAMDDLTSTITSSRPNLIIFSGMQPDTIKTIQAIHETSGAPLIYLTSNSSTEERIESLLAGADHCLKKPIDPRELSAHVAALLRRSSNLGSSVDSETREWRFKGLTVLANRRRVTVDGNPIELTTAEFDLLKLFVAKSNQVLSRESILEQLRGIEWEAVDRSIDILVSRLRDKLSDDPRKPRFIRTVRSVGYQFVGELAD
jgi:DNA-binding response OmpR family regulator